MPHGEMPRGEMLRSEMLRFAQHDRTRRLAVDAVLEHRSSIRRPGVGRGRWRASRPCTQPSSPPRRRAGACPPPKPCRTSTPGGGQAPTLRYWTGALALVSVRGHYSKDRTAFSAPGVDRQGTACLTKLPSAIPKRQHGPATAAQPGRIPVTERQRFPAHRPSLPARRDPLVTICSSLSARHYLLVALRSSLSARRSPARR